MTEIEASWNRLKPSLCELPLICRAETLAQNARTHIAVLTNASTNGQLGYQDHFGTLMQSAELSGEWEPWEQVAKHLDEALRDVKKKIAEDSRSGKRRRLR